MSDLDDLREKIARELHDFSCHALDPDDECGCWCGAGDRADIVIAKAVQPLIDRCETAEAAVARVRDMHRAIPVYAPEDVCPNEDEEHREEKHHEYSDEPGEYYCEDIRDGSVCAECTIEWDTFTEHLEWPCATIRALDGEVSGL